MGFITVKSASKMTLAVYSAQQLTNPARIGPQSPNDGIHYCEVCFKDDPSRIFCPTTDQSCPNWSARGFGEGDYSYWSGYDDGTICDCGSPFIIEISWSPNQRDKPKLRRPMQ